jgi:hypothetical protein
MAALKFGPVGLVASKNKSIPRLAMRMGLSHLCTQSNRQRPASQFRACGVHAGQGTADHSTNFGRCAADFDLSGHRWQKRWPGSAGRNNRLEIAKNVQTRLTWVCNALPVSPIFARALSEPGSNQGCACNAPGQPGSNALAWRKWMGESLTGSASSSAFPRWN